MYTYVYIYIYICVCIHIPTYTHVCALLPPQQAIVLTLCPYMPAVQGEEKRSKHTRQKDRRLLGDQPEGVIAQAERNNKTSWKSETSEFVIDSTSNFRVYDVVEDVCLLLGVAATCFVMCCHAVQEILNDPKALLDRLFNFDKDHGHCSLEL